MQLVVRERHAAGGAGAGEPDQMFRADVRREDGRADDDPAKVAAGEEVVVGRVAGPENRPPREAEQKPKYTATTSQSSQIIARKRRRCS